MAGLNALVDTWKMRLGTIPQAEVPGGGWLTLALLDGEGDECILGLTLQEHPSGAIGRMTQATQISADANQVTVEFTLSNGLGTCRIVWRKAGTATIAGVPGKQTYDHEVDALQTSKTGIYLLTFWDGYQEVRMRLVRSVAA